VSIACGDRQAVAVVDQIRASAKERFGNRIGFATALEMETLEEALREILSIS
jgi:mRNA-degrading endonuclease toxin of MazEF toxin-antitoxin module